MTNENYETNPNVDNSKTPQTLAAKRDNTRFNWSFTPGRRQTDPIPPVGTGFLAELPAVQLFDSPDHLLVLEHIEAALAALAAQALSLGRRLGQPPHRAVFGCNRRCRKGLQSHPRKSSRAARRNRALVVQCAGWS